MGQCIICKTSAGLWKNVHPLCVDILTNKINEKITNLNKKTSQLDILVQLEKEKYKGFPTVNSLIDYIIEKNDDKIFYGLKYKKHKALKAAATVKKVNAGKRVALNELTQYKLKLESLSLIYPQILELLESDDDSMEDMLKTFIEINYNKDPVSNYLSIKEWKELPLTERNQRALDNYWKKKKSNWVIGRDYERYVGWYFEEKGFNVEYTGIKNGFEDRGRDLICKKDKKTFIIQCKYWATYKKIYEKHIFQLFGTTIQYKIENKEKEVFPIFVTSTKLSDFAKKISEELNIKIYQNFVFDNKYPCIKCNINNNNKIYHLPIDQQYDNTIITKNKGEFYAFTVKEAEEAGFRRAYRWQGNK